MERALLLRHAESVANVRGALNGDPLHDEGLSEAGREQARALGGRLGAIDLVATSPFRRAAETAALAAPAAPALVLPELGEIRFGRFEGGGYLSYRAWAAAAGPAEPAPGGGESRLDAVRRYLRAYRAVLAREEATVLVVAHGLVIRYALDALAELAPRPVLDGVPNGEPFAVGAAELERAVSLLERWAQEPRW